MSASLHSLDYSLKTEMKGPIYVVPSELPSGNHWQAHAHKRLPTVGKVRRRATEDGANIIQNFRPDPVHIPELGLIVKLGTDITIAEGQCLWFLRQKLGHQVPVPEVYGWTCDEGETFLYMELVLAPTLADRWPGLIEAEKLAVCEQLRHMIASWRFPS
jgi:hypothetical protein